MDLSGLTRQLKAVPPRDLTPDDVAGAAAELVSAETADQAKADFLAALAEKGETAAEVAAFAAAFRSRARDPGVAEWAPRAIDVVGTGGDHAGAFNISSLVVLTLASAGVAVMKHGNRGLTSKCGSADIFSALGVDLAAPPEKLRRALAELGYVFFFAPNFHSAFQHINPVRKALAAQGRRTVFNLLGPLLNPGRPAHALVGVFAERWVAPIAAAFGVLGAHTGLVAFGRIDGTRGTDELTTATDNQVHGFGRLSDLDTCWTAEGFGLRRALFTELAGSDLTANLALIEALLAGHGPAGLADTIVLNAAIGLWICGRLPRIEEGLPIARDLLLGGAVKKKISDTREFYRS